MRNVSWLRYLRIQVKFAGFFDGNKKGIWGTLSINGNDIEIGREINDYFSPSAVEKIISTLQTNTTQTIKDYQVSETTYDIDVTPLSGRFRDKGVILSLKQVEN